MFILRTEPCQPCQPCKPSQPGALNKRLRQCPTQNPELRTQNTELRTENFTNTMLIVPPNKMPTFKARYEE